MNPPLVFFQVAATVIPALLIAIAVGMRTGHVLAEQNKGKSKNIEDLSVVLVFALLIGVGEVNSLLAVANNGGTRVQGFWAYQGVIFALSQVANELVMPVLKRAEPNIVLLAARGFMIVLAVVALIFGAETFLSR